MTTEDFALADDATILRWDVYLPPGAGPFPIALVIHPGQFRGGGRHGPGIPGCCEDLAAAGIMACSIDYRLAPPGLLPGQVTDGRYPQQMADVAMAVLAARFDSRCTGKVGSVGGSSGGTHAAMACGTGEKVYDRLDAGVSLSGAYAFADRTPNPNLASFVNAVKNYCGTNNRTVQLACSPVRLIDAGIAPLFYIQAALDTMPPAQVSALEAQLAALGVTNSRAMTVGATDHAFGYWPLVKDQVIPWLLTHLAP